MLVSVVQILEQGERMCPRIFPSMMWLVSLDDRLLRRRNTWELCSDTVGESECGAVRP